MSRQPSTDLYFRNACGDLLSRWWRRGPLRQVDATSFVSGDWRILIRGDNPRAAAAALAWPGRLAYVIDDDVAGAAECRALPADYRARMAGFARDCHAPLLARADVLLAASDVLAGVLQSEAPHSTIRRIDPAWTLPLADTAHFAPLAAGGAIHIVHLGSGTHEAALAAMAPAMVDLLNGDAARHFTYFAARPVLPALEGHPQARRLAPKPWAEYLRWLARQRFHLALYPLLETRFDRARSANKLSEHAIIGAAGLYPQSWAPARALGAGAMLAPEDPRQWGEALHAAIARGAELAGVANAATAVLSSRDATATQRALWCDLLELKG